MRIKRLISAGLLAAMVTMSVGTVAQAYNENYYNEDISFNEFQGSVNTSYENKDTSSSIYLSYNYGGSSYSNYIPFRFGTMGSVGSRGDGAIDVSNGNYYTFYPGDYTTNMYNYVNEWGYNYAAIQATNIGDSAASINITFKLDN